MEIKNFFVNDKENFINYILEELCKNNTKYIYIKELDEIHIENHIIRFFDKNDNVKNTKTVSLNILRKIYTKKQDKE